MATDLEQLSVTLSAKIDDFKRGMQDAVKDFDQGANQIEQRNLQLTQTMSRNMQGAAESTRFLAGALKSLVSVAVFQQLIDGAIKANTELAKLAQTAKTLEVSTDKLQRFNYAGKTLGGLSADQVGQGAESLAAKANAEVREGEGKLTSLLEANNLKLTDRAGKVKDIDSLLEMAARLIQNAASEADKIHIAELFGLTKDWVRALEGGAPAWRKAQEEAGKVGAVIDEKIINKAADFDKAWNQSWSNWATRAKSAAVEAASAIRQGIEAAKDLAGQAADPKVLLQIAEQHAAAGNAELENYFRTRAQSQAGRVLGQAMSTTGQQFGPDYLPFGQRDVVAGSGSGAAGGLRLGTEILGRTPGTNTVVPKEGKTPAEKDDELDREEKRIQKQINALNGQAAAIGKVGEAAGTAEARERLFSAAQEAGREITPALRLEIEKLAEAYGKVKSQVEAAKLEQDVEFERSQVFRTSDEQAIASRTRRLGADDAERLGKSLREVQNLTEGKEMATSFVKGLISDLENGVKAGKALENQLKRILEKLADKALDKLISGAFGGLGGLFSGSGGSLATEAQGGYGPDLPVAMQAQGGWAGIGPKTMVPLAAFRGARQFAAGGGIPAILHAGEIVLNQAQQKNVAASMGSGPKGPINLTHAPVINGTGLSKEEVFSLMQKSQKEFQRNIGPVLQDWQRRYA